jgi:nickel-type superoxide dismutase maturation protease
MIHLDTTPDVVRPNRVGGDVVLRWPGWLRAPLHWRFARFVVTGDSMLPALRPGDCLLVSAWAHIHAGDVLVLRRPHVDGLLLVKRAIRREDAGWWVLSDNAGAGLDDSRAFGVLPDACVVGKVLFRYYRPRR